MFPGEEERKRRRLSKSLPDGELVAAGIAPSRRQKLQAAPPTVSAAASCTRRSAHRLSPRRRASIRPDTLRDLSKISEVNQKIFRQQDARGQCLTPRSAKVGAYFARNPARWGKVVGTPGRPPGNGGGVFAPPGVKPRHRGAQVVLLLAHIEKAEAG